MQSIKIGIYVKTIGKSIVLIEGYIGNSYKVRFENGYTSIGYWRDEYFVESAPEGFTLEEAKLFFAL